MALSSAALGLHAAYAPALTPAAIVLGTAACSPALGMAAGHYARTSGHGLTLGPMLSVRPFTLVFETIPVDPEHFTDVLLPVFGCKDGD